MPFFLPKVASLTICDLDVDELSTNNELDCNSHGCEHRTIENWSREVLRLLPDRLTSAIDKTVHEDRLRILWKEFASNQLHEILRETLKEAVS
jgi:hypothetical protein